MAMPLADRLELVRHAAAIADEPDGWAHAERQPFVELGLPVEQRAHRCQDQNLKETDERGMRERQIERRADARPSKQHKSLTLRAVV